MSEVITFFNERAVLIDAQNTIGAFWDLKYPAGQI